MKQVLLAPRHIRREEAPPPPIVMWMTDDTHLGDTFLFHRRAWVVSNIYTTSFPSSVCTECRHTERPRRHIQAGVTLDHHSDPTHPGN